MKIKKIAAIGAAFGVVLSGVAIAAPASADPVSNSYVAVGSDTLQDSMNALTNGFRNGSSTVRVTAANLAVGNYDAFPATGSGSMIQTKPAGAYFLRPQGSSNGRAALIASILGGDGTTKWNGVTVTNQIDIARSSAGPSQAETSSAGDLAFVPYGRDAVSFAYKTTSTNTAWAFLTKAQLVEIYTCADTDGNNTNGVQRFAIDGVVVKPVIPQSGSGTRNFFLDALGGTSRLSIDTVNCVRLGTEENNAGVLAADEIIPFSVASWVAQSNGAAPSTIGTTGVKIGSTVETTVGSGVAVAPVTGSGSTTAPNPTFYANTTFGRDTYLIVEWARINPGAKYDATLDLLITQLTSFQTDTPAQVGSVKKRFGFLPVNDPSAIRAVDIY